MNHPVLCRVRTRTGFGFSRALRVGLNPVLLGAGFQDTVRSLAWLAVDEAASNIEEHAYHGRTGMPVWAMARRIGPGRIQVALFDRAPVPYPAEMPIPDLIELARTRAKRGRGRAFVQGIAESVRYRPRRGGGNTLILVLDRDTLLKNLKENSSDAA